MHHGVVKLPGIHKQRLQTTKDVVPVGLRSLDYWQIMDYWKMFDKNGDGQLDKNEFFCLVNRMNHGEHVDRARSDQMFECVDADRSGEIDCEEFLSWIFQMYAPYSGGLRERLGDMDPRQVAEYFKRIDTNGNGSLDKGEFARFVSKFLPEANLSTRESNDLFDLIDKDLSGEIDVEEFLRWVYPGLDPDDPRGRRRSPIDGGDQGKRSGGRSMSPAGIGSRSASPSKSRTSVLQDVRMNANPVVLEFTIGPDFKHTMLQIEKAFSRKLAGPVTTKIIIDKTRSGCCRFVLKIGRGVVLWDKPTMMAYRDDPFATFESSKVFIMDTIRQRMPTLLNACRTGR